MKLLFKTVLLLLTFALVIAPVRGQVETGTITGTVRDASGAAVAGATVTARNTATSVERSATTGNSGQYTIPALTPGIYELTVTSAGFAKFTAQVEVTVGAVVTVEPQLSVSNQTTTIEVVAAGGVEVNTQTQELSQIVNTQQMAELPSLTRNPYDFVQIAGNVSGGDRTASGADQNNTGRGVGFSINGQRSSGTEVLLDGVENLDLFTASLGEQIPLDSVQEFRVITNDFDSQYGRASGGVVNVSTKSGTNSLHGGVWEFNRLSAYTANTFQNAVTGARKGTYTRNQFGYDVGGPILKDKLFFFQSTEWLRVRSSAVLQAWTPTPQFLALTAPNVQSYFAAFGNTPFNFASTITQAQIIGLVGSVPGGTFSKIPAGTPVLGQVNFTAPSDAGGGFPQNTHRIMGRADFNLNNSTQMFFRYALENLVDFNGSIFASPYSQYNVGDSQYNNSGLFGLNHSFTPALYSSSKISFSRLNINQTFTPSSLNVPELLMTAAPTTIRSFPIQLPGLFAQFAGSGGLPFGGPQNVLQLLQDFSWTKNKHTVRFGGLYDYQQINTAFGAFAQALQQLGADAPHAFDNLVSGNLTLFQAAVNPQGKFPCRRGVTGQLITNVVPSCTLTLPATQPSFARSYRYHDWAAYLQDSWRVTPRFTFNYGFRYEYFGVQHNNNQNLDSNFYFGPGSTFFQQIRNGSVQIAPQSPVGGLWNPNYGTIGPRIGFAYDIFGDGKTSIRGGYGISYERNFGNVTFNVIQNPPAYASVQITAATPGVPPPVVTNNNLGPFAGANGTVPLSPSSLRHVNQNIGTASTQFVSLALERQVARNTVVALEYSGAHGIHLYDIAASNPLGGGQIYLGDGFDGVDYTRVDNQFTGINTRGSNGSSHYSALNIRFQTQNLHNSGLSVTANYTWAHSTDDLSSTFSESTQGASVGIGNLGYLDPRNPRLDWGSSDFDVRHRVVVAPIYELPLFKSGRGWKRQALGGWTLVGIFIARTGTPFSVFDTTSSLNAGAGNGIPRLVPSTPITSLNAHTPQNVGPNQFTILTLPTANSAGFDPFLKSPNFPTGISDFGPFPGNMTGRNMFRGLGAWNLDAAITKSFQLTERFKLEFRAEGFDIFNHHNFYTLETNLDAANFTGVPITVTAFKGGLGTNNVSGVNHDERRFGQFALRLLF
ncbi:MAG: Oar protein [Candidatus Acidoferrum typicum]|nr:Oar protein [Candidatus Acidoferrum typicum]